MLIFLPWHFIQDAKQNHKPNLQHEVNESPSKDHETTGLAHQLADLLMMLGFSVHVGLHLLPLIRQGHYYLKHRKTKNGHVFEAFKKEVRSVHDILHKKIKPVPKKPIFRWETNSEGSMTIILLQETQEARALFDYFCQEAQNRDIKHRRTTKTRLKVYPATPQPSN